MFESILSTECLSSPRSNQIFLNYTVSFVLTPIVRQKQDIFLFTTTLYQHLGCPSFTSNVITGIYLEKKCLH